jgi:mono/diheme cytochrome c family protein
MRIIVSVIASVVVVLSASTAFAQDPKLIEQGQQLYGTHKCSMCHAVAGKGNKAGTLDDVGSRLSDEDIRQWLINPRAMEAKTKATRKPLMPSYQKLTKDELEALVAYLKSLTKK